MNINDHNLLTAIELLRSESSSQNLTQNIVTSILDEQETKPQPNFRFARLGPPLIATGCAVIGLFFIPFVAVANPVEQVRRALLSADEYRILTFEEFAGERIPIAESRVKQGKRETHILLNQGKTVTLSPELKLAQDEVSNKVKLLSPGEFVSGIHQLNRLQVLSESMILPNDKDDIILPRELLPSQSLMLPESEVLQMQERTLKLEPIKLHLNPNQNSKKLKVNSKPLLLNPERLILSGLENQPLLLDPVKIILKPETIKSFKLKPFKLIDPPILQKTESQARSATVLSFIKSEMSIESLQILLKDETIWNISHELIFHDALWPQGRSLDIFRLTEGLIDLEVYVDPTTKRPLLSRLRTDENGEIKITEVEYHFDSSESLTSKICDEANHSNETMNLQNLY